MISFEDFDSDSIPMDERAPPAPLLPPIEYSRKLLVAPFCKPKPLFRQSIPQSHREKWTQKAFVHVKLLRHLMHGILGSFALYLCSVLILKSSNCIAILLLFSLAIHYYYAHILLAYRLLIINSEKSTMNEWNYNSRNHTHLPFENNNNEHKKIVPSDHYEAPISFSWTS